MGIDIDELYRRIDSAHSAGELRELVPETNKAGSLMEAVFLKCKILFRINELAIEVLDKRISKLEEKG